MSGHNHNHCCECKHEQVRYCAKCRVVHCLGCNKEWRESVTSWTSPWITYGTTATLAGPNIRTSGTSLKGPSDYTVTCSHEVTNAR